MVQLTVAFLLAEQELEPIAPHFLPGSLGDAVLPPSSWKTGWSDGIPLTYPPVWILFLLWENKKGRLWGLK